LNTAAKQAIVVQPAVMGAEDPLDAVQAAAWHASIPLKVTLAADDIVTEHKPRPVLAMVSRLGYLPYVAAQLKHLFQHLLPPGDDTPWFEYNGQALQWQHPAGVLYDLHAQGHNRPWSLTVHYRACPVSLLLPWTPEVGQSTFINSLKEAAVITGGNAGRVMNMTSAAQAEMRKGVAAGNMQQVAALLKQLGFGASSTRLPVRFLLTTSGDFVGEHHRETISVPLPAADPTGQALTLGQALRQILPQQMAGNSDDTQASSPSIQAWVGGTQPSFLLPLAWLYARLVGADRFLYIVVKLQ
jgi:hypothetical protein